MSNGDNVEASFEWALKNGDLDQVKAIVTKDKTVTNKQLPGGRYALCLAADYGQTDIINFLLSNGANVNVSDKYGISPLLAAIYEGHTDCVRLLLNKGAVKTGKAPDGSSNVDCATDDVIKQLLV
jgi:ankyrin repeat protein